MKAMILAGGLSTRLRPLTYTVPKPCVRVAGEPVSAHVIRYLKSFGVTEIAINVFYFADQVVETFGDGSQYGVKIHYLHEKELTGAAGPVKAMEWFFDEPFVVVGCDDLTDLDLATLMRVREEKNAIAAIGLAEAEEVDQYGVVITDPDGKIVDFQEKPAKGTERSHLVNTGIYAFTPEIFKWIPADTFYDFGKQVFPELQKANAAFYGVKLDGYWCDIGTIPEYRRATDDVLAGRVRLLGGNAIGIAPDVTRGQNVRIEGTVSIGPGTVIGDNVTIVGPAVIGPNARIANGATLERAILWDAVHVGEGATLRDTIVGNGYAVDAGANLGETVVAEEPEAVTM